MRILILLLFTSSCFAGDFNKSGVDRVFIINHEGLPPKVRTAIKGEATVQAKTLESALEQLADKARTLHCNGVLYAQAVMGDDGVAKITASLVQFRNPVEVQLSGYPYAIR